MISHNLSTRRPLKGVTLLLLFVAFAFLASALKGGEKGALIDKDLDSGYETENQNVFHPYSRPSHNRPNDAPLQFSPMAMANVLEELHEALDVMQKEYFSIWLGKWTSAIDWTAAVMGTYISGTLYSLSHSLSYTMPGTFDKERKLDVEAQMVENEINRYFSQSIAYYFGEDYFAIRTQANDDMLWVVLGWLESIRFIDSHSDRHYPPTGDRTMGESEWHGEQFIPAFAHRARVFYELASEGWDWELCGGGMTWNSHLLPYKNAITNQLFISASVGMYLHFPGDDNCSPFMGVRDGNKLPDWKKLKVQEQGDLEGCENVASKPLYDPIYLANAINGYDWLKNIGMTNEHGLYVDGFHIKDYATNHSKTQCDERNEMVYTYNQGVLLSGLRGLWEATGNLTYLVDGHELVRNVIRATGWTDTEISPTIALSQEQKPESNPKPKPTTSTWSGLGSSGILTELCDPSGVCNQDGQTFKGIFFHHLVSFCTPLPSTATQPGKTHGADRATAKLHSSSCNEYTPWVLHNARAAGETRDSKGRFGMGWGAGQEKEKGGKKVRAPMLEPHMLRHDEQAEYASLLPEGAVDYRNDASQLSSFQLPTVETGGEHLTQHSRDTVPELEMGEDPNLRGRGRTVETQGGGVAVTRAMWEFLRRFEDWDSDVE